MVSFDLVSKTFDGGSSETGFAALSNVNLDIEKGSTTAIIGRSGAGKSTLIRMVNGLEKPSRGRVLVDGTDVATLDETQLRTLRRSIGMIFQHFNLLASRTVFDNVALPLEITGLPRHEIVARVAPLLDLVGLADKRDRYPSEISGGQKQRVGIARALATNPKLLLSDEATSALDPETTQAVLDLLRRINRELGLTILLITHEMEVVKRVADRVAVIDAGTIVESGATYDVFSAPQHATTKALLSGLPGYRLPPEIAQQLKPAPSASSHAVLRLSAAAQSAESGLSASLFSRLGAGHALLSGFVDEIGGRPLASFIVKIPASTAQTEKLQAELSPLGVNHEVLGYVD
ncbi:methionine ABC transporter ATP-binding protein [Oryzicola mucosus]|uniref:methionine ABC transporter ATP-binding protein n=1 Tax=Oryzicola mucosus TaxID=2767425 RepID=UPI002ED9DFAE